MPIRSLLIWGVILLVAVVLFTALGGGGASRGANELAYSQLMNKVDAGEISQVTTQGDSLLSSAKDGKR